ncbi:MAG TPA: hypothetical protein VFA71_07705, partial [Terriglobales bacterium]|nr:hypothetical protein [Terriglobales bacterium]
REMTFAAHAVVNVEELPQPEKLAPAMAHPQTVAIPQMSHPALPIAAGAAAIHLHSSRGATPEVSSTQSSSSAPFSSLPTSPAPSQSFTALLDNGLFVPPDTQGAVSPTQLLVVENGTFLVQTRTGGFVQSKSLDNFWSPLGAGMVPNNSRVLYDPYNNRWIMVAEANAQMSTSAFLIAVSKTSDATGLWSEWKVNSDAGYWANFPALGFNANWIAVGMDMVPLSGCGCSFKENIYVFNKAQLYSGASDPFVTFTDTTGAFGFVPAVTFDNNASTPLYLLQTWNGNQIDGFGYLRMAWITGTPASPVFNNGSDCSSVFCIQFSTPWGQFGTGTNAGFAPQSGTSTLIDTLDDRMRSLIFRNGNLWGAQTVFLPASAPTHSAVQWFEFDTSGNGFFQRIDDVNAAEFRAYPTISVNKFDDALIGYSTFSASTFVSAAYSFESHTDPGVAAEGERQLIAGSGPYVKFFGSTINKWGFYSNTVVDPINDTDLWTIQEFASTNVGSTGDFGRWGTWWGKISVPTNLLVTAPATAVAGVPFTVTVTAKDASNNTDAPYTGTVHFTATGSFTVPPDYTFVPGDNGVHTFSNGFTLTTAGSQTVTATDTVSGINGNATVAVTAAAAKSFTWSNVPLTATIGVAFPATLTAFDNFNNIATTYTGSVQLSTTGTPTVTPSGPNPYTFTSGASSDNGVHTFSFTANTGVGSTFTITGNDAGNVITATSPSIRVTADLPIAGAGHRIRMFRSNVPVVLATFTDSDSAETGTNLSATINWGDGTPTVGAGVVRVGSTNVFNVMGAHNYAKKSMYTVTVTLNDNNNGAGNGSSAIAISTVTFLPRNFSR